MNRLGESEINSLITADEIRWLGLPPKRYEDAIALLDEGETLGFYYRIPNRKPVYLRDVDSENYWLLSILLISAIFAIGEQA